uniref:Uncharacterized protein n=1 Tax=Setaria italica TaxID=4555 RepID=K3YKQ8_SETIT
MLYLYDMSCSWELYILVIKLKVLCNIIFAVFRHIYVHSDNRTAIPYLESMCVLPFT